MTNGAAPSVVIAGGGTGGHLFPGLAVAEALTGHGVAVTFVGTAGGIEVREVPAAGYPLRLVPGQQLRGGGGARAVRAVGATLRGVVHARTLLRKLAPRLVVGVGGYASVAVVLAARLRRIPAILLEQNVVPGAANRMLGRFTSRICLGFAEAARFFPAGRTVYTGNPIRRGILTAGPRRASARRGLLVVGGSQGAHRLNEAMTAAAGLLGAELAGVDVVHQTGVTDRDAVAARYATLGLHARVEAFLGDMGTVYAATDVVLARAGAMTCAELTAVGLPAILVPYPFAADDHQRHNAEVLVRAGAAMMILDRDLDGERLATALRTLLGDANRHAAMAAASRALGRPQAAEQVAAECLALM
jgi:UDP-N-acetylglucosamine--N-acetylmuramyl-(pentapeptide) pyrophosphoryl-undecaprenol N-acetylglucosamine transferase